MRIWLPTAFGASVLVAEIPLVYAAAARSADGDRALAALGIRVAVLVVVNTPALAPAPLVAVEAGIAASGHRRGLCRRRRGAPRRCRRHRAAGPVGHGRAGYHPGSRTGRKEPVVAQQTTTDVVDELTTDHREALGLLDRIAASTGAVERRDLADTVIAEVVRHAVAEEMYVYPAVREHVPDGEKEVEHDIEEHKELEETMKRLESVDATDPRFDELVRTMTEQLRHHAHDEEANQFPQLREHIPHDDLVKLREKVETAKKVAPTRPHPNAPNAELFHKLVGPGVGLVDRLRDRLTHRSS
ncbi:hemerythrin domain-containing protein [Pseudonocardia adelaidensis]|uniref:Hemerythrin-like domain-containing protein n=1 Tax=Pseudonocardia adelaidensis TaxID=648754 RepID=A0ABP9NTI1_9PSEU